MKLGPVEYREVWAVDFEFTAQTGLPPSPICMVARELGTGRVLRIWENDLRAMRAAPFATDADALMVAYYASAEIGCFLALGWPVPANLLDLYSEFRNRTNGLPTPCGWGLIGALTYFGLDAMAGAEKESMRQLAMRGGPYTDQERAVLLDYCQEDVDALGKLLGAMGTEIDWPRALLRGRYMIAAARMERQGVPIDLETLTVLRLHWQGIQDRLIERIDKDYGVFDGRTFKRDRWAAWLARNGIPWPQLPSGGMDLTDDTFREMARAFPAVAPIRELRYSLSQMRLAELAVGPDGRNRCMLSAFRSRTGRNQPSNTQFIFGPSVWLRGLIQPPPGHAVAYVDWSQQEFGIAAALSGDEAMMEAYNSGDPYLTFAKQAGAAPPDATKKTHGHVRDQYKACVLAVQYGMGAESLAIRILQPPIVARELLQRHRETYRRFWSWSDAAVSYAMLHGSLHTVFGWTIRTAPEANPRSLANFPMQANGAEMLRLACIFATERGISVCCPVHDAILVEGATEHIEGIVAATQQAMADASAAVLGGFRLRTDAKIIRHPERYMDERGQRTWATVQELVRELATANAPLPPRPTHEGHGDLPVESYLSPISEDVHGGTSTRRESGPEPARPKDPLETTVKSTATAVPEGTDPVAVAGQSILVTG